MKKITIKIKKTKKIKRIFLITSLFLIEKTKSFLKKIFRISSIISAKTVPVKELLKNKVSSN